MYGLLALSTALALFYNGVVRAASVRDSGQKTMRFNVVVAAVSALMALLFGGGLEAPHGDTWLFGLLYGGTMSLNLFFRARALETGPLSATLLLGCSSMLITTALGALLWHETVAPVQAVGVAAMLLAMFMSIAPGRGGVVSRKWVLYSAGLFVTNGVSGLILKGHQSSAGADQYGLLLCIGFGISAVAMGGLAQGLRKGSGRDQRLDRRQWMLACVCGVAGCGYNLLNTLLSGRIPSVIFFPIFNGAVIAFSLPVAMLFFREKATGRQVAGIFLAVVAILLIGNVFSA